MISCCRKFSTNIFRKPQSPSHNRKTHTIRRHIIFVSVRLYVQVWWLVIIRSGLPSRRLKTLEERGRRFSQSSVSGTNTLPKLPCDLCAVKTTYMPSMYCPGINGLKVSPLGHFRQRTKREAKRSASSPGLQVNAKGKGGGRRAGKSQRPGGQPSM